MTLHLLPHVHAARIGEDLVLLDVRADAYICAPGGVAALNPDPTLRRLEPSAGPLAHADLEQLRLAARAFVAPPPPPPPRPSLELPPQAVSPLSLREAARLALAVFDVIRHYLGRPLDHILTVAAAPAGRRRRSPDPAETLRLARLFEACAIWLPVSRKCLVRSFVLLRFLQRSGCAAQWVFGVRTWPFGAHCWLQLEDIVLDDDPGRLAAYEPILAVQG